MPARGLSNSWMVLTTEPPGSRTTTMPSGEVLIILTGTHSESVQNQARGDGGEEDEVADPIELALGGASVGVADFVCPAVAACLGPSVADCSCGGEDLLA